MAEAEQLGVTGTPTFFINGKPVKGAVTFATLKAQIDQELDQRMVRNHHASFSRIALPQLLTSSIQDPCTSFPSPNAPILAREAGWVASFMPKPYAHLPGCGLHLHISL